MRAERLSRRLLLVLAALCAVLPLASIVRAQDDGEAVGRVVAIQNRCTASLFQIGNGVVGTATGRGADGQPCVIVFLANQNLAGRIPQSIEGVAVAVKVTGELVAHGHRKEIYDRPVPIGTSSGPERLISDQGSLFCTTGTLACRVTNGNDVFALSNAHVYALEGSNPNGGPVVVGPDGDRVLQPGRVDAVSVCDLVGADEIGRLFAFKPIVFSELANNTIDAAIARSTTDLLGTSTPDGLGYGTPNSVTRPLSLDDVDVLRVQKLGRTTDLTKGIVTAINASVNISYGGVLARFNQQIVIEGTAGPFSDGGDSGSLIVTDDGNKNPVALLFAGNSSVTIGNPIDLVLAEFGVTVDDGSGCTADTDCDDGIACTIDVCSGGTCSNAPGSCPNDGVFCNGTESCDAVDGCVSSGDPCLASEVCNESAMTCDPLPTGEGFILSKNVDLSTDDRTFTRTDTLYMRVWSDRIDFNRLRKAEFELKSGDRVKRPLTNNFDGTYTVAYDLINLPNNSTVWQWKAKVEDKNRRKFQPSTNITVLDAPACSIDADCHDLNACTLDLCTAGVCSNTAITCDDGNVCTADSCDPDVGCVNVPLIPCCGDALCDGGEDACSCPGDCGAAPAFEMSCADGVDNDCDGLTDCADSDCTGDPACPVSADVVTIISAEWKADRRELKVRAISSDQPGVTLTLVGFGDMPFKKNKYEYKKKPEANPGTITVISSDGGSATTTVVVK